MPVKSESDMETELKRIRDARVAARETFKHFQDDESAPSGMIDQDNPPLTDHQLAQMRPAHEVHPNLVNAHLRRKGGRPRSKVLKTLVSMRLDPDVIEALKAGGDRWQTRANALLRRALGLVG